MLFLTYKKHVKSRKDNDDVTAIRFKPEANANASRCYLNRHAKANKACPTVKLMQTTGAVG